jgi:hypothetical protein
MAELGERRALFIAEHRQPGPIPAIFRHHVFDRGCAMAQQR